MEDHRGQVVERGGLRVDDAQFGPVLAGQSGNPGRGIHLQRTAHDQDDVGGHRQSLGIAQGSDRQGLAEENDGGFQEAPAASGTARRAVLAIHPVRLIAWQAGLTVEAHDLVRRAV